MTLRTGITISDLLKDFEKVRIACPKCNRGSQYTVRRVRQDPNLKCPTCRAAFSVVVTVHDQTSGASTAP